MNLPLPPEQIERAARIYRTSKEAAAAIGCSSVHFQRLCKRYGIETPIQRRKQNAAPLSRTERVIRQAEWDNQQHQYAADVGR
jgi:hypothetical protein